MQPRHGAWPVDSPTQYQRGQICGKVLQVVHPGPRDLSGDSASERINLGQDQAKKSAKDQTLISLPDGKKLTKGVGLQ